MLTIVGAEPELSRDKEQAPVRLSRAFRISSVAAMTALALSGCMRQPTAMVRPRNALDALAYGGRMASAPPPVPRRGLWNTPGLWDTPAIAAAPVVYAAAAAGCTIPPIASMPATGCASWSTARKASPTPIWSMPAAASPCHLIGAVTARGRTPAELVRRHRRALAQRLYPPALCRRRGRGLPAVLHSRRGGGSRPVSVRAEHDRRKRGGHRRRLLAPRQDATASPSPTPMPAAPSVSVVPTATLLSPGDTVLIDERWF